jgi:hypothetical protein
LCFTTKTLRTSHQCKYVKNVKPNLVTWLFLVPLCDASLPPQGAHRGGENAFAFEF